MSDLQSDYKAFVAKLFNRTGDLSKDFTHAVLGIVTEIDELFNANDTTNALEETGDLAFFLEALNIVMEDFIATHPGHLEQGSEIAEEWTRILERVALAENPFAPLHAITVELMDEAKRWVGYGKQPKDMRLSVLRGTIATNLAVSLSKYQGGSWEDAMRANMAKLLVRYPGGEFDAYRAVERDLEAERAELEKH